MDKSKPILPGLAAPNLTKESLQKMRADLPVLTEYMTLYAAVIKAKYDALRTEGFTEQQALELCRWI